MEKWLLVLLIVGSTALVFLVCFPIDFYLYRRRKRQARERNKFPNFAPKPVARAGQCHASVTIKPSISSVWTEDIKRKQVASKGGFARIVGLIRKKQQEEKAHIQQPPEVVTSPRKNSTELHSRDTSNSQKTLVPASPKRKIEWPKLTTRSLTTTHVVTAHDIHNQHVTSSNEPVPKAGEIISNAEDDSLLSVQPRRKLSNVSAAWSENEELMERDYRHLDYGALRSLENLNNPVQTESGRQSACYTISIGRQASFPTHESCTDTDEVQAPSASEHIYSSKSPTKVDFVHTDRGFGRVKYSKMHANFTSDSNLLQQSTDRHTSTTSNESSEEYNVTQPILKSSRSANFPLGSFARSCSDQNMFVLRESKSRSKSKKKNSVTPTNKTLSSGTLSSSIEQCNSEQAGHAAQMDNGSDVDSRHLEKSRESSGKTKRSKKKRKKAFLKKQSSESLPDLSGV